MMGTDWADCQIVAELIGTKTFTNELVAYEKLSEYIDNRETGVGPTISVSSIVSYIFFFPLNKHLHLSWSVTVSK